MVFLIFVSSSRAVIFHGKFVNITFGSLGGVYSYRVDSTENGNSFDVEEVRGAHAVGKTFEDVLGLKIEEDLNSSTQIPKGIDKFFANLKAIAWQGGNLESVSADDLHPFNKLQFLYLYGNKIVSLAGDVLKHSLNLQFISFDQNLIKHVEHGLFSNLTKLERASFRLNICVNEVANFAETVQQLNLKLPIYCPPFSWTTSTHETTTQENSSTTIEGECDIRCSLNEEVDSLIIQLTEQNRKINEQNEVIQKQFDLINKLFDGVTRNDERITELEKQLREISSGPCSPCF